MSNTGGASVAPPITISTILKILPLLAVAVGGIVAGAIGLDRLSVQAEDIGDNAADIILAEGAIETNQTAIVGLTRSLDATNSNLALEIERLQNQIALSDANEAAKLNAILAVLKQLQADQRREPFRD